MVELGEQWLIEPGAKESFELRASTVLHVAGFSLASSAFLQIADIEAGGQSVIGCPACRSFGVFGDSRRRGYQDEAFDEVRVQKCKVQAVAPSERVPCIRGLPARLCYQSRAGDKVGSYRGGAAVAWQVDEDDLVL